MGTETNRDDRNTPEYLTQLLKDKKQLQALPNIFTHADKLLDEEINRVRLTLFHHQEKSKLCLPEPIGPTVSLQEKLFVPVKEHPDFNFVGRILGPRGMTAKELEQHTGCKIMVRGKGSMRDKAKEDQNRGKPNWEHLSEDLHVLITVEDTRNRAEVKLSRAKDEIQRLLVPAPEGEDDLKKRQLMELAIINGTYRDTTKPPSAACHHPAISGHGARFLQPVQLPMRAATPSPAGAPIILAPRLPPQLAPMTVTSTGIFNGAPPPLVSPPGEAGTLMYNPYEQIQHTVPLSLAAAATAAPTVMEYPRLDPTAAAGATKMRRIVGVREHPYSRV
ncbi:KH domain-containing RNA-binding protein qki.L-like isoform X2 [Babylonia areolata]|uniref:KH domain-containing RNA-binding protein qki.L-like isoform X2 n=1 Tax=Babylonia areolata TaxID=304850 RepID=UPI003FD37131